MRLSIIRFSQLIHIHNKSKWPSKILEDVIENCTVVPEFITQSEEAALLKEIEPHMKRLKYEKAHWDDVSMAYELLS